MEHYAMASPIGVIGLTSGMSPMPAGYSVYFQ
jgi:hypothetical protein